MDDSSETIAELRPAKFDSHLKRRTVTSIVWTMGQAAGDQLFSFAVFVMLARLLDKTAIGTFAIAFVFMDIGRNFASAGVMQRVARSRDLSERDLDTIFWANILLALVYSTLVVMLAPVATRLFDAPQLGPVLIWLTIPVVLSGAGNTHMALRLREFGHKTLALRSLWGGLLGGLCGVLAALYGAGIWALVVQRLVRELICTVLAWSSYPWRPGVRFDFEEAGLYMKNSLDLGFAQVVTLLSLRAQDLGVARVMGPVALSSYRVAWRCAELIGPQVVGPFATVALQTFSRLQDHRAQLRETYLLMLQQCALISVPALVGYAVAGPWLVPALFGPQWHEAGAIAPMLLPLALPFTINGFVIALLAANGRISWQRHLALLDLLTTILVTALTVSHGLRWLALAYSIRAVLLIPFQIQLVRRASGIGAGDHVRTLAVPVIGATIMGVVAAISFHLFNPGNVFVIILMCAGVAILYAGIISAMLPGYRRRLWEAAATYMQNAGVERA